jgi:hypothetical protein
MKNLIRIGLLIFILTSVSSCEKEDLITDSIRIENELKSFAEQNGVTKCNIYLWYQEQRTLQHGDVAFDISDGFIIISQRLNSTYSVQTRYNLLYLSKYELITNDNVKSFNIYFSNISPSN